MELLFDLDAWASLITLTALEVVLGIDNIIVLSILTHALPQREAQQARAVGLALALALRLALLFSISWIMRLTYPVLTVAGQGFSWRDLILIGGGLFLMVKAIQEVHAEIEGGEAPAGTARLKTSFGAVVSQIALMDLVFSLDSIITAVGLARDIEVMVAAICIAIGIMFVAARPVGGFIKRHPTAKMLGLCFLLMIGVALISDGFGLHFPRGYMYFAMAFSAAVEAFNIWAKGSTNRRSGVPSSLADESANQPPNPSSHLDVLKNSALPPRKNRSQRRKLRRK